ncbi:leucyl/phenylalanyl-tRNA--protein transferase [Qipengyuania sediminis]|uniref:leucyl/phenylalanyl-tRNA--protein transferase n=1 Tax=Qipengyuania sediminis TaxID=1532023 RepID=UPI00105A1985|nr:leucyl/phenylalanyl-tRNA--protein transferase [Qipengyuania sediminis]
MHSPARPAPPDAEPIPVDLLLLAYRAGIFPMSDARDDAEVHWIEPRERAIIPLDAFRLSRSLAKRIAKERFRVSCDEAFAAVIRECAAPRGDGGSSWISHRIEASYLALHAEGHAHSVECWLPGDHGGERLAGGLYGVAFDRVFCGESMFSRADDASKVALAWLVASLRRAGFALLDCQFMTPHLATLGAIAMPQARYLDLLAAARGAPRASLPQAVSAIVAGVGDGVAGAGDGDGETGAGRRSGASDRPLETAPSPPSSPGKRIVQSLTQTS